MSAIISVRDVSKTYAGGFQALKSVSIDIEEGEIIALLGPNGAGKTTLISVICGLVNATSGTVTVGGHDIRRDWRQARAMIGLVPQEMSLEIFETVWDNARFSRGLFGKPPDAAALEEVLASLSLADKKTEKTMALSGGMKRRLMIAKALSHGPRILFLDEPTAGVDVALRKDMWNTVRRLREAGTTVILTTHYIEEAEEMADRVAVINRGEILLVEDKDDLMKKMGTKRLTVELREPVAAIPQSLSDYGLERSPDGLKLAYEYDSRGERTGITRLLADMNAAGLHLADLSTDQTSLEDIFIRLVREDP